MFPFGAPDPFFYKQPSFFTRESADIIPLLRRINTIMVHFCFTKKQLFYQVEMKLAFGIISNDVSPKNEDYK